jgi:Domain of unknown function (DUF4389)
MTVPLEGSDPMGGSDVHPAVVTIDRQQSYSRGWAVLGVFFLIGRAIVAIPILIVLYFFGIIAFLLAWIMQFVILFTGRYPEGPHDILTMFLRWQLRTYAFIYGLSDKYPTSPQP